MNDRGHLAAAGGHAPEGQLLTGPDGGVAGREPGGQGGGGAVPGAAAAADGQGQAVLPIAESEVVLPIGQAHRNTKAAALPGALHLFAVHCQRLCGVAGPHDKDLRRINQRVIGRVAYVQLFRVFQRNSGQRPGLSRIGVAQQQAPGRGIIAYFAVVCQHKASGLAVPRIVEQLAAGHTALQRRYHRGHLGAGVLPALTPSNVLPAGHLRQHRQQAGQVIFLYQLSQLFPGQLGIPAQGQRQAALSQPGKLIPQFLRRQTVPPQSQTRRFVFQLFGGGIVPLYRRPDSRAAIGGLAQQLQPGVILLVRHLPVQRLYAVLPRENKQLPQRFLFGLLPLPRGKLWGFGVIQSVLQAFHPGNLQRQLVHTDPQRGAGKRRLRRLRDGKALPQQPGQAHGSGRDAHGEQQHGDYRQFSGFLFHFGFLPWASLTAQSPPAGNHRRQFSGPGGSPAAADRTGKRSSDPPPP